MFEVLFFLIFTEKAGASFKEKGVVFCLDLKEQFENPKKAPSAFKQKHSFFLYPQHTRNLIHFFTYTHW